MDIILHTILPFAGVLIVLIVIHELGHYITAKLTGVKVLEAGLGYPPRLWGFTWRDTIYSINWLPLGGFVCLLGEQDPAPPQTPGAVQDAPASRAEPVSVPDTLSPEEAIGRQSGDVILAVNGHETRNTAEGGGAQPR